MGWSFLPQELHLSMEEAHHFLETLAIVLSAGAVTTVVFQRLKQPVVLGYLLAGMLVGPYTPFPVFADEHLVHTLSELGVVLLMFSLGIEFSLKKLLRVGPTAGFVAVLQCSLMVWVGYLAAQAFGWSKLTSFYAGAAIAISSTTIIVKAFAERGIKGEFTQIVFGILIVEDLIAILLITVLTTLSNGKELGATELALTAGRLSLFLGAVIVVGLLTVPWLTQFIIHLKRTETTVVASIGLAFGLASLATAFGYSAALGAFIAGSLVAESGAERRVEHLVEPVRDIFAAIFFVSVGMLIDPSTILQDWLLVLIFLVLVIVGKVVSVSVGAFLTGESVQTSVKCGMSLAQIGEFSFIIAGVGVATKATDNTLYSIAVAVSGITTLLTPWLIQAAEPTAKFIDRKLPRALQTFASLYGSWLEQLKSGPADGRTAVIRQRIRWLIVDMLVVAAVIIGASLDMERISDWAENKLNVPELYSRWAVVLAAIAISCPFWIGMIRVARYLGFELAFRALPGGNGARADMAAAPRRLLVVTLQLAILLIVGLPLLAVTQPFLPPFRGAMLLAVLLVVLAISFWRGASNFQGHTSAAAQAIAEAISRRTRNTRAEENSSQLEDVNEMLVGLGSPVPIPLPPDSPAIGKTLAQTNLRGLTGATVLAIARGANSVLVPSGHERLLAGDVLAVAGTHEAIKAARQLVGMEQ